MLNHEQLASLAESIKGWGQGLGFGRVGVSGIDLTAQSESFKDWLANQFHGTMTFLNRNIEKRLDPSLLVPGTARVICVRMNYLIPEHGSEACLKDTQRAYISRYALGRDYHKLMRQRLKALTKKIQEEVADCGGRVFTDSAPVLERPLAVQAGLGWVGKHTLVMSRDAGSYFFLGEIFTNLPLPIDQPQTAHCGQCTQCIDVCPTKAIIAPYKLDARRCISYLTIEYKGRIEPELRLLMGNRIFGCDDCQLFCPWNKFAKHSQEHDFQPRHGLNNAKLIDLFQWSEVQFLEKTLGSPLRRGGYSNWQRNIAIGLGNADYDPKIITVLADSLGSYSDLVDEHIVWALEQQEQKRYAADS